MSTEPEIPVFQPYLGPEVYDAAKAALDGGWLAIGSLTYAFEEELARYLSLDRHDRHLLTLSSGTAALHSACQLIGLGPGDEVICPSFTYVACHQAISATGADVVFCDVDEATLGIDPQSAREALSERTKAIMAVHYAGIPCRIDEIHALAREHDLRVVEDAAHAFGSRHAGRLIGTFGDLVCFSFGPVKVITSLEGGALVSADPDDVQRVRELRLLGVDTDRALRSNTRMWDYDVVRQGWRYHMSSMQASVGRAQLALVDRFVENRRAYCRYYSERFAELPGVAVPRTDFSDLSMFIYFLVLEDPGIRPDLVAHMAARGVHTGVHFQGAHEFTFYADRRRTELPVTESLAARQLTIPLHSFMDERTLERVVESVTSFFD
ncbi:MAG TPA: DegT/DnrJ/EryC1/StrS family aminotransferase [Gaiellaceae bacterium]|nr:DegT/DnrJ/EryC1/StrS family aminotransferase [Gaiellaceae bacterium]